MYTVKTKGSWNLYDARKCLARNGTFDEIIEAMKELW